MMTQLPIKNSSALYRGIFLVLMFHCFSLFGDGGSTSTEFSAKRITVIGTGYVGLVLGVGLAEWGHQVICADILEDKIRSLNNGEVPFYEPGLDTLVKSNVIAERLTFTTDIIKALQSSEIIFIAVGTPSREDGSADISAVEAVAKTIGQNLTDRKLVCLKSTVPIGVSRKIKEIISQNIPSECTNTFDMSFTPEFLREGSALIDFFITDRVVIGAETSYANETLKAIFKPLIDQNTPLIETTLETAEAIKYASNAFLATKISFINEFANFCEATGADISVVAQGMGLDKRICPEFLKPGPGYGGSCFPKDTLGLLHQSKELGVDLKVVQATVDANDAQMVRVVTKLSVLMKHEISGKKIAILGLAFKANTDDVRSSPSIPIIEEIIAKGGKITAYDPMAMSNMKKIMPKIKYADSIEEAVENADAVIVLTDWEEIRNLNLSLLIDLMHQPILIDAKNLYNPQELADLGFKFDNIGRNISP